LGLDEDGGFIGIETGGQIIERDFDDVVAYFLGHAEVIGQSLGVGNHDVDLIVIARILQFDSPS
jgi:hypothetical protein